MSNGFKGEAWALSTHRYPNVGYGQTALLVVIRIKAKVWDKA